MTIRLKGADQLGPQDLAQQVSLRYVQDDVPGIQRRRAGRGFVYFYPSDRPIRSRREKERINALAIPPAWQDVWICPWPNGHIQATGRDDRGRKQYIYHPRWQQATSQIKFARLHLFGAVLPKIRRQAYRDLQGRASERKLLAGMVQLLDTAGLRIGNEEYTVQNGSYGLTTLRRQHVTVNGKSISIRFQGKGGQKQRIEVEVDPLLAGFLRSCRESARGRLFSYEASGGKRCQVQADDLNGYLALIGEDSFTAKDFRTWKGTCTAAWHLFHRLDERRVRRRKGIILEALDQAAEVLGNTRSVCREHYVHPAVLEVYEQGEFPQACEGLRLRRKKWLGKDEQLTLHLLAKLQD